ncbi:magnesium transporter [Paratractidigestivibacter faecalis]|uniref:magnesium transporter n=1 Tax=Paratractidigestivibacter faecalis TaxID=2292441 RepID=UPI0026F01272|nr:CBS domain-containing protein [Paratractidigestivibacter faecalis]MDD6417094.1 CBS domain-containing protein [Paratractidigestivibacter faecalis]MDY6014123.1 CBS domain-containing protein [Paratractidigestivibacter faecalis]
MIYLSQLMGNPVYAADGEKIGTVSDLGIATGEVFPRVTSLAFKGPGRTPFMISWRKYVDTYDEKEIHLKVPAVEIRFSYLQPDEVLIARDILNKQIVDTRGMRVVRVNDLKLSDTSSTQLRLLGAEVGARGILRSLSPALEHVALKVARTFGHPIPERIIAWSYMDLVERDLSNVKLSVSHKTLDDMHPADIADIIERLDPRLRGQVFAQLDDEQRAGAMAEFDDDAMAAELMGGMNEREASRMLSEMDPDDAAELVSELDYDKAEKLLRLMGVQEQRAIRQLLGYREDTAGRIMTSEFAALPEDKTAADAVELLRGLDEDFESVRYVYLSDEDNKLSGVVTLNALIVAEPETPLADICTREVITASPEDDQEDVAEDIAKYNLLAMPVVADDGHLLGIVTVDDALDVLEEEHAEDLQIAGGIASDDESAHGGDLLWLLRRNAWFFIWMLGVGLFVTLSYLTPAFQAPLSEMLLVCSALPIALVLADDSVSYVTNFFLENDPDDEDSPSMLGFTIKSVVLGIAFAALVVLVEMALDSVLVAAVHAPADLSGQLRASFAAAAIAVLVAFVLCPIWLLVLRKRDEKNQDTSGFALSVIAMIVALVVFCLAMGQLANALGILGVFA